MKLLIRDYLASLREREELDAILPDLLSELGFTVISRPQRGTQQRGVDIAAMGCDQSGEKKIYLFSVKAGDLTRQDWDGSPQALRSSLNEIRDVYIKNRILPQYQTLKIVICLAFGGGVQEQVRDQLKGYIEDNTTDRVSFEEWNGDHIAGLLLSGILREELLPKPLRSSFQKAVAMVDEPDISYQHFATLTAALRQIGGDSQRDSIRAARQLNICLWVLFVWARDRGNVEAAYRASELALLSVWDLLRPFIGAKGKGIEDLSQQLFQVVNMHRIVSVELLEKKVFPHVEVLHGLSMAIGSRSNADINLALFEMLGRIGLTGLWLYWNASILESAEDRRGVQEAVVRFALAGLAMIRSNPVLLLPLADRQATDVALFLLLSLASGVGKEEIALWLEEMAARLVFTVRTRGRYPSATSDYRDLAAHPRDRSDEYFQESTAGSTLIPLIMAWLEGLGRVEAVQELATLAKECLPHTTMQLWIPDETFEDRVFDGDSHGWSLPDLPVHEGGAALVRTISEACKMYGLEGVKSVSTGFWHVLLVACRHYQLPVPPHLWINALMPLKDHQGGQIDPVSSDAMGVS